MMYSYEIWTKHFSETNTDNTFAEEESKTELLVKCKSLSDVCLYLDITQAQARDRLNKWAVRQGGFGYKILRFRKVNKTRT